MEAESDKEGNSYSVIFIGPNNEVGGKNTGLGKTKQEAVEAGGNEDHFYGVSRHPTEDKFIKGAHLTRVASYVVIKGYFPQEPCHVNENGEIFVGDEIWKPSNVEKLMQKGILIINQ